MLGGACQPALRPLVVFCGVPLCLPCCSQYDLPNEQKYGVKNLFQVRTLVTLRGLQGIHRRWSALRQAVLQGRVLNCDGCLAHMF